MLRFVEHDGIRFACETRIGKGSGGAVGANQLGGTAESAGTSPPWLILLHGLGGDRSQVIDLAPPTAARVLALDFRGTASPNPWALPRPSASGSSRRTSRP
jgi:pimeloyl-ACP methyl ester carboxylesterase